MAEQFNSKVEIQGIVEIQNEAGNSQTIRLDRDTGNITLDGEIIIKDWTIAVPDYVFASDYKLRGLDELASFISLNHHLPEIPSAQEIAGQGVNVGKFCMRLLQKVEEMSLYTIQQEQVIRQQSARLAKLEQKLSGSLG